MDIFQQMQNLKAMSKPATATAPTATPIPAATANSTANLGAALPRQEMTVQAVSAPKITENLETPRDNMLECGDDEPQIQEQPQLQDTNNPILKMLREKLEFCVKDSLEEKLQLSADSIPEILATIKLMPNVPDVFIHECLDIALPALQAQKEKYVLNLLSGSKKKRAAAKPSILPSIMLAADALSGKSTDVSTLDLTLDMDLLKSNMQALENSKDD